MLRISASLRFWREARQLTLYIDPGNIYPSSSSKTTLSILNNNKLIDAVLSSRYCVKILVVAVI